MDYVLPEVAAAGRSFGIASDGDIAGLERGSATSVISLTRSARGVT
jgi:hypothetical protein